MAGNARQMHGPMRGRGPKQKVENPGKIMKRLFGYMLKNYKLQFFIVVVCIITTAVATLRGTLFMKSLIDDYIVPMTQTQNPDFAPLAIALKQLITMYVIGIICAYAYNRIMVNVSQGTMRKLRTDLFTHMESLPIKYFDTHAHGDIMSVYTNDVDTLRQLMSQSIPQTINSLVTIVITFGSMIVLDVPLTLISLFMVGVMMFT
ncbi:MAG TPA: ABC transporter ATP-binding protein, partial [Candidatus Fimicola cottocaccae]|nr:ABC transporter ATP-binding protein [Candidatus Fimicola cottocaccae]